MGCRGRGREVVAVTLVGLAVIAGACGGGSTSQPTPSPEPGQQSAGDPAKAGYTPAAAIVADSVFRPKDHGLPFENYGPELPDGSTPTNMTADDVRAMFGDRVCAGAKAGRCDLIPEAQLWLDDVNHEMAAGHCYGFSVVAELLWQRRLDPAAFGAPAIPGLDIEDSKSLQRLIASAWAMQLLDSVRAKAVAGAPHEVLAALRKALVPNPKETYTLVFFKADGRGGHAVTPYAVEDKGGGKFNVLIYDNNWPSVPRAVSFDTTRDTWTYDAAVNPKQRSELYAGDAKTQSIYLFPTSPGLGVQPCPFCDKRRTSQTKERARATADAVETEEIFLDGSDTNHAHLVITDGAGHRLGYVGGHLVNEIPGARVEQLVANRDWMEDVEPHFLVPAGPKYTITVDASALRGADTETFGLIGPSSDLYVKDVSVHPGDKDTLVVDGDDHSASFAPSRPQAWTLGVGVSDDVAEYAFELKGRSDQTHPSIALDLMPDTGALTLTRPGATGPSTVDLSLTKETDEGPQSFNRPGVSLLGSEPAVLDYGTWR